MRYLMTRIVFSFLVCALSVSVAFAQQSKAKSPSRKISFSEAQSLLASETEGNLTKQAGRFSRTKLSDGRVLEVYYPISTPNPAKRSRPITAPGYGVLFESEAAFDNATRPRHMLEDLIPDGRIFLENMPSIIGRLEKRVGKLNYSRESLRKLDGLVAGFHSSHTTAQTDPKLFQEITAYYGETLRRAVNGEWKIREEKVGKTHIQTEPNIAIAVSGKTKEIKPWSSVTLALYDEEKRGLRLSKIFDTDLEAAR